MTNSNLRNIAASVHQRLLNRSKESARPFNELLQYYAIERFLYRLSRSSYSERFVLKGALIWKAFLRKNRMFGDPDTFEEAVAAVSLFLKPVIDCLVNYKATPVAWTAPGPWQR